MIFLVYCLSVCLSVCLCVCVCACFSIHEKSTSHLIWLVHGKSINSTVYCVTHSFCSNNYEHCCMLDYSHYLAF